VIVHSALQVVAVACIGDVFSIIVLSGQQQLVSLSFKLAATTLVSAIAVVLASSSSVGSSCVCSSSADVCGSVNVTHTYAASVCSVLHVLCR
jgi:hypothetical protein